MSDPDILTTRPMPRPRVTSTSSVEFVALAAQDAATSARAMERFRRLRTMLPVR